VSFDEQSDGPLRGECHQEIRRLEIQLAALEDTRFHLLSDVSDLTAVVLMLRQEILNCKDDFNYIYDLGMDVSGLRDWLAKRIIQIANIDIQACTNLPPPPTGTNEQYVGAREDLSIWKRRALEAEESLRRIIARINEENGPTFMGEPVITEPQTDVQAAAVGLTQTPLEN